MVDVGFRGSDSELETKGRVGQSVSGLWHPHVPDVAFPCGLPSSLEAPLLSVCIWLSAAVNQRLTEWSQGPSWPEFPLRKREAWSGRPLKVTQIL